MLDEQLSREVDAILEQVVAGGETSVCPQSMAHLEQHASPRDAQSVRHIQWRSLPVPKACLATEPKAPLTAAKKHSLSATRHSCKTMAPLKLPDFKFPDFDFEALSRPWDQCPGLESPISPLIPSLPSWCPRLPAFTPENLWLHGSPIFFDLSSLSEPKTETSTSSDGKDHQLQLWRGIDFKPKKQSRFFPISEPTNEIVRSRSNACRLFSRDEGIIDLPMPPPPEGVTVTNLQVIEIDGSKMKMSLPDLAAEEEHLAPLDKTAATLWNILDNSGGPVGYQNTSKDCQPLPPYCDPYPHYSESPVELDGKELPYVHANSLIGTSNETAASQNVVEDPLVLDSAIFMGTPEEPLAGINELMVDQEYDSFKTPAKSTFPASVESPILPSLSFYGDLCSLYGILPSGVIGEDEKVNEQILENSDSHFVNEQQLFAPLIVSETEPEPIPSQDEESMDTSLEEFWMVDETEEIPELISAEDLTEEEEGWMVYSTTDHSSKEQVRSGSDIQNNFNTDWEIKWAEYCDDGYGLHKTSEFDWDWDF